MTGSLRALLEDRVRLQPDVVVVQAGAIGLTWRGLNEQARRVASSLVRDGVQLQNRVIYLGKNDPRFFEVLFGCALAGAVFTPLNWRLAPSELAWIITDAKATVAFVEGDVRPASVDGIATIVSLSAHEAWQPYDRWCGPAEDPDVPARPEDIAFQLYTSGTTGRPKGVMFANGANLRILLTRIAQAWGFAPGNAILVALPLFHMGGLAWALAGLARGARCVLVRDFDPSGVLATMEAEKVSVAFFVPAMLSALSAAPDLASRRLALRRVFYSGAPISPTALARAIAALGCDFVQIYGLTEATGAFAQLPAEDHGPEGPRAHLLLSAGRPYPWVEVRVMSAGEEGESREVRLGTVGEIWTRSEQNLVGYWNNPEETARALTTDGWLRTGDLGRIDAEGRIFLIDRAKDLVISGGENVYPLEVENVLAAHSALAEVAVIGVPHERWGETVKAIVVVRAGAAIDADALIQFAREHLARFKCPTSIDFVTALPRTATGKVLKHVLREPYWQSFQRRIN